MTDWRRPQDYAYTRGLSRDQWAWEFLRRNPGYRRDWAWFSERWASLERDYGRPPERDFQAWKSDPRAYVEAEDDEAAEGCRVDQDRVLIECWLGAKWGFYKFPLAPETVAPAPEELAWRPLEAEVRILDGGDGDWLGANPARIALGFELDLPLREQIEAAKRQLLVIQRGRRRQGGIRMRTVEGLREAWTLELRILDARSLGSPDTELDEGLDIQGGERLRLEREALGLLEGGYRVLPTLPERG